MRSMFVSNKEVLIKAEHVSKKFCRSLKRSLWYGAQDVGRSLMPWRKSEQSNQIEGEAESRLPSLRQEEFWAVQDVSFEVRRGECLGIIGHNGAGKSTLLKILNSLNSPDAGRITMRGRVGALIELGAGFNPVLTGRENIYNQAALLGFNKKETDARFQEIIDFSELEASLDSPVMNYSSGMKVRLGFAIFATMEPDIMLLDEVLAVGDIGFQIKCYNKINELSDRCAMIFVSHNMPQLAKVSTNLIVLENGLVSFKGKNIAEGIGKYYAQFRGFQSFVHERNLLRISRFRFQSAHVSSPDDRIELCYGGDLDIEIELEGEVSNEQEISIIFKILDQSFIPIVNSQTPRMQFSKTLTLKIKRLLLAPGTYSLDAYANLHHSGSGSEEVVSYYKSFVTLIVVGEHVSNHAAFQIAPEIVTL